MPTVVPTEITGYAHCVDPRCPGHEQEPVPTIRSETSFLYTENGGDLPGIERSYVHYAFADLEDSVCRHCNGHREVTDQARKQYAPLSGHDQNGLLAVARFDPNRQAELLRSAPTNDERAQFEAERQQMFEQMRAMQEQVTQLTTALLTGQLPSIQPSQQPAQTAPPLEPDTKVVFPPSSFVDDVPDVQAAQAELAERIAKQQAELARLEALEAQRPQPGTLPADVADSLEARNGSHPDAAAHAAQAEQEAAQLTEQEAAEVLARMSPEERERIRVALEAIGEAE